MKARKSAAAAVEAICREGLALHRSGRLEDAARQYRKALLRDPNHFDSLNLLGAICVQSGQAERGVAALARAIRINPNAADTQCLLGLGLFGTGRPREAVAAYDRAIAVQPGYAEAHYNRGLALSALERHEAALADYERAIALRPDHVKARLARGSALGELGRHAEALASFDAASLLDPSLPEAHYNRGLLLHQMRRPNDATASFDRAIALAPEYVDAHLNRAFSLLSTGNFAAGWAAYEWRKRCAGDAPRHAGRGRPWSGERPADGERLLLYHEQGLGDTIQFARYIAEVRDRGIAFAVSVQAPLVSLLRHSAPDVEVLGEGARPAGFDLCCSLLSLPLAFGTTPTSIPTHTPYLRADAARRARFEALLGPKRRPRIGLAWSGSPAHANDHNRSMAFERLTPLLTDAAEWFAVQKEIRPADEAALRASGKVRFLGDQLEDLSDTAAMVDLLDLVIGVDTSVVHLAGAMGKPVWILLPHIPDWRWLWDRTDSPWYPTARLFRQPRTGDWAGVIEAIGADLPAVIGAG